MQSKFVFLMLNILLAKCTLNILFTKCLQMYFYTGKLGFLCCYILLCKILRHCKVAEHFVNKMFSKASQFLPPRPPFALPFSRDTKKHFGKAILLAKCKGKDFVKWKEKLIFLFCKTK